MAITSSFFVSNDRLLQLQQLVKQFDLRFQSCHPSQLSERTYVTLYAHNVENYNKFQQEWKRYTVPLVERVRPLPWHRRVAQFFRTLFC